MNTHSLRFMLCRGALAIGLAACGGGAEVLVIPLFTFGFTGSSGTTTVDLDVDPSDPTTANGSFNLANLSVDGNTIRYDGTWSSCTFRLTLAAGETLVAPAAAGYDGRFQGADTIVLTPNTGAGPPSLTLQRRQAGTLPRSSPC